MIGSRCSVCRLLIADSFILDTGGDIFVWNGVKANAQEKAKAFSHARSFLKEKGRPSWTPVTRVSQGVEPALFKSYFRGAFTEVSGLAVGLVG